MPSFKPFMIVETSSSSRILIGQ